MILLFGVFNVLPLLLYLVMESPSPAVIYLISYSRESMFFLCNNALVVIFMTDLRKNASRRLDTVAVVIEVGYFCVKIWISIKRGVSWKPDAVLLVVVVVLLKVCWQVSERSER